MQKKESPKKNQKKRIKVGTSGTYMNIQGVVGWLSKTILESHRRLLDYALKVIGWLSKTVLESHRNRNCICVFVYLCICVFVYLCIYVFLYLCICVFMYFCFCGFVFLCICVFVYFCNCVFALHTYILHLHGTLHFPALNSKSPLLLGFLCWDNFVDF